MDRHLSYQELFKTLAESPWTGFPSNHNGGPPLDDHPRPWGNNPPVKYAIWRKASQDALVNIPTEIALRRARKAKALGLTFREYQLEILERGRYLQPSDKDRIAEIIAKRGVRD